MICDRWKSLIWAIPSQNGDAPLDTQELVRNPKPLSAMLDRNDSINAMQTPQALCRISCFVNFGLFWCLGKIPSLPSQLKICHDLP
jgi:hypothetical protein